MAKFASSPKFQGFDSNGDPLSSGKLYTYEPGTTTDKATYPTIADAIAKTNANANPVILDSRGEADVVLAGNTKLVLKDSTDSTIWTLDNVNNDTDTVLDDNGNEMMSFVTTASAVNYLQITNAATGNDIDIAALGDDDNIGISFTCKGTGSVSFSPALALSELTGPLSIDIEDTRTNSVVTCLTVNGTTTGTPAAGIGTGILFEAESGDESPSNVAAINASFSDVSAGSEDGQLILQTRYAGNALDDSYIFEKTAAGDVKFTHAATASRTITIPDADRDLGDLNVTVAEMADGTDGELITWDASGAPTTVAVGTSGQILTSNGAGAAPTFQTPAGAQNLVQCISVDFPGSSEDLTIFYTDVAITISQLSAVLLGSSTPSVTWTVRHDPDRSASGNEVVTSGTTTTSTTTGDEVTSFNDATVPANSWVWLETTAQSGTVTELAVSIEYTED